MRETSVFCALWIPALPRLSHSLALEARALFARHGPLSRFRLQGWLLSTHSRSQRALPRWLDSLGLISASLFSGCAALGKVLALSVVCLLRQNVVLGLNELVYLKCLAQDLGKSRCSVNVNSCDCYCLKTGWVSLEMFMTLLGEC